MICFSNRAGAQRNPIHERVQPKPKQHADPAESLARFRIVFVNIPMLVAIIVANVRRFFMFVQVRRFDVRFVIVNMVLVLAVRMFVFTNRPVVMMLMEDTQQQEHAHDSAKSCHACF